MHKDLTKSLFYYAEVEINICHQKNVGGQQLVYLYMQVVTLVRVDSMGVRSTVSVSPANQINNPMCTN